MLKILYYPIDTKLDFQECINAMYSFNTSGIPILFKVKGTNRYVAIVQSIVGDIIESSGSSYSYHKFIQDQSGTAILCSYINQYVKDEDGNIFNEI